MGMGAPPSTLAPTPRLAALPRFFLLLAPLQCSLHRFLTPWRFHLRVIKEEAIPAVHLKNPNGGPGVLGIGTWRLRKPTSSQLGPL